MKRCLALAIISIVLLEYAVAQPITLMGPAGSGFYGNKVTVLTNGNYVVSDPGYDNGTISNVGAVYLYNGSTNAIIATLKGTAVDDQVGGGGITALTNGNYVVSSPRCDNGLIANAGGVTWGNGTTGVSGTLSTANSIMGTNAGDSVGSLGVVTLTNGNYVISSPYWNNGTIPDVGAVTWRNGTIATSGTVSSSNSLVSANANDRIGGAIALPGGNYVTGSWNWNNSSGFVAWGSGASGVSGLISAGNSLVGTTPGDMVGSTGIIVLANGNYVVCSDNWRNGTVFHAGAVTWASGATGITGAVSSANSLVGSSVTDGVGFAWPLSNGNYIVNSTNWDNGAIVDVGAVTWGNGTTGITGVISASNSLIGASANERISGGPVANGNYVVTSPYWDNGTIADVGAVTWGNGTTGITGVVNAGNSMIGSSANDRIGALAALSNGNYLVGSTTWDNGSMVDVGAVCWVNGSTGTSGTVTASNSLIGSTAGDAVGRVTPLSNGNYVITSPAWDYGTIANAGAATWADGSTGLTGTISVTNSMVGSTAADEVGKGGVTALTNGNYVIRSSGWDNGSSVNAGAVTWGRGTGGTIGIVGSGNSLVGSNAGDSIGSIAVVALANGNYVVGSSAWHNGSIVNAGAVTWSVGTAGISGAISASNSLVGTTANDALGQDIVALNTGDYIVSCPAWDNYGVANTGAVTLANGTAGLNGPITKCNSAAGTVLGFSHTISYAFNATQNNLVVGLPYENKVIIFRPGNQLLATNSTTSTQTIAGSTSMPFFDTVCRIVTSIQRTGTAAVNGAITAKVFVQNSTPTYAGRAYVRRYYNIEPSNNPNAATGTVTLYFTQAEINDYNNSNGTDPDLPTGPSDAAGIAALRINVQHGNSASGLPGSYTGWTGIGAANIIIDPADNNIIYNASLNRWEVTFPVTGWGGFFAWGGPGPALNVAGPVKGTITLAPVPAGDNITIKSTNAALNGKPATIADIQGRCIATFPLQPEQRIDISQWAAGIYTLRLADGSVYRITKQ